MKIAIIGAGGAGLCAGRHCLDQKIDFDIFEQTGNVGGTWNYTDCIDVDENGISVHSSMYKDLRTNLPKEVMSYEDFPYPDKIQSYISQEEVVDYMNSFSKTFQINPHIQFYKQVVKVKPSDSGWFAEIEDVRRKNKEELQYDAIMVCNGHNKQPFIPAIPGIETFSGRIKHSHDYRSPESYQNKIVLIIGAGPSGTDISQQIGNVATKVYLSCNSETFSRLPENIHRKPLLFGLSGNEAVFVDGTREKIYEILLCTGYVYDFPFLTPECGISVKNNNIYPLYKHIISIENPSLGFIGVPTIVCPFPLFDIQVRFFLSTIMGHFKLPAKEILLEELNKDIAKRVKNFMKKYHFLGEAQGDYFDDLAETAKIKKVRPVINKLYLRVRMGRNREDCFQIVDDEKWKQVK